MEYEMQNAKCKIRERGTGRQLWHKDHFPIGDNDFSGIRSQSLTIKQAFAIAKGFMRA
jgi:hypothetical protein